MAIAKLNLSGLEDFLRQLNQLPPDLQRIADGIIGDEAKAMAANVRAAYRETYDVHSGDLAGNVIAQPLGRGRLVFAWRVFNASGKAHWFEYAPGTALRWTKDAFTATARRRARKQAAGGAFRGRMQVQESASAIGGFSGTKATPTTRSTAVFRPIFIPLAIRHRRRMVERLVALLEQRGFRVDAGAQRAA